MTIWSCKPPQLNLLYHTSPFPILHPTSPPSSSLHPTLILPTPHPHPPSLLPTLILPPYTPPSSSLPFPHPHPPSLLPTLILPPPHPHPPSSPPSSSLPPPHPHPPSLLPRCWSVLSSWTCLTTDSSRWKGWRHSCQCPHSMSASTSSLSRLTSAD